MAMKLFGTTQQPFKPINYESKDTNDIDISVDNSSRIISATIQPRIKNEYQGTINSIYSKIEKLTDELSYLKSEYTEHLHALIETDRVFDNTLNNHNTKITNLETELDKLVKDFEKHIQEQLSQNGDFEQSLDELNKGISVLQEDLQKYNEDLSNEITRLSEQDISLDKNKADKATTLAGYGITDAYTKSEVDRAISAMTHMSTKIVSTLPSVEDAEVGTIYLVQDENAESGNYIEYILVVDGDNRSIEKIGSTATDLSNYITSEQLDTDLKPYAKTEDVVSSTDFETFKTENTQKIATAYNELNAYKADVNNQFDELESYIDKFHPIAFVKTPYPNAKTFAYGSTGEISKIEFTLNKKPQTLDLEGSEAKEELSETSNNVKYSFDWSNITSENYAGNQSANSVTKRISAEDSAGNALSSIITSTFTHYIFYGLGDKLISNLSSLSAELRTSNQIGDRSANVTGGKYFWYCCPKMYGTPTFKVGGFEGGFELISENLTAKYGNIDVTYTCYRTTNSNLGQTTFNIS